MRFPSVYLQLGYTNLKQLICNLELLDAKTLFFQQLFVMHCKQVRLCVMAVLCRGEDSVSYDYNKIIFKIIGLKSFAILEQQ